MESIYTAKELTIQLGSGIRTLRLQKNIDRQTVCDLAQISMNALRHLESGQGATISTLIKTLVVLKKEDWLLAIAPQISINPLHMTRSGKPRQRAKKISKIERTGLEHKRYLLKSKYGLTIKQYRAMFDLQEGKCGNPKCSQKLDLQHRSTHVDHDHTTGKIRSLMCSGCNSALGLLKEDPDRIKGLADYVKKHNP